MENDHLQSLLRDEVVEQNEVAVVQSVPVTDKMYYSAFSYLSKTNIIIIFYKITLMLVIPSFIIHSMPFHLFIFLILLILAFLLQLSYLFSIKNCLHNQIIFYSAAIITNHLKIMPANELSQQVRNMNQRYVDVVDFRYPQLMVQDQREIYKLAKIIYEQITNSSDYLRVIGLAQFFFYQTMHFWAITLIFSHDFQDKSMKIFIVFVILCGLYQYNTFYIALFFVVLIIPYVAILKIYRTIRQQYKKYKMARALKSQPFSDNIKGDKECHICLMAYEKDQQIIVLKCAQTHHFHDLCFRQWLKNAITCPLCRKDVSSF